MRRRRNRKQPYKSGYCMFAHGQYPCKGWVENGVLVKPRVILCACECHGDWETRMRDAGLELPGEDEPEEDDECETSSV